MIFGLMKTTNLFIVLAKTLGIDGSAFHFYVGTLIYAGLYLIEGLGLFFDKGWAEWLTVITTAGFLPLEILKLSVKLTFLRVLIFILNVLMVIYLTSASRWRHLAKFAGVDAQTDPEPMHESTRKPPPPTAT